MMHPAFRSWAQTFFVSAVASRTTLAQGVFILLAVIFALLSDSYRRQEKPDETPRD